MRNAYLSIAISKPNTKSSFERFFLSKKTNKHTHNIRFLRATNAIACNHNERMPRTVMAYIQRWQTNDRRCILSNIQNSDACAEDYCDWHTTIARMYATMQHTHVHCACTLHRLSFFVLERIFISSTSNCKHRIL